MKRPLPPAADAIHQTDTPSISVVGLHLAGFPVRLHRCRLVRAPIRCRTFRARPGTWRAKPSSPYPGAQAATTILRALAVDDVQPADVLKLALREAAAGLTMGLVNAAATLSVVSCIFDPQVAVVVAVTLVAIGLLAAFGGTGDAHLRLHARHRSRGVLRAFRDDHRRYDRPHRLFPRGASGSRPLGARLGSEPDRRIAQGLHVNDATIIRSDCRVNSHSACLRAAKCVPSASERCIECRLIMTRGS